MYFDALEKAFIKKQIESGATLVIEDPEEFYGRTSMANVIICNPALTAEEVRMYSWPGPSTKTQWWYSYWIL